MQSSESPNPHPDHVLQHNVLAESFFSAFNGVYMGLAIFVAPVVAVAAVGVSPLELTVLVCSFPVGAFLGPFWAVLGQRWGMRNLVTVSTTIASVGLMMVFFVDRSHPVVFTALLSLSQILNSAMRMGQNTLYRLMYPTEIRGRVLGRLIFWTYLTMVPSILLTGWLLDISSEMYRVLYPVAGMCGLFSAIFYYRLYVPDDSAPAVRPGMGSRLRAAERVLVQDRAYLLFQIAFFLSGSSYFMSAHIILLLVSDRFGFGALELSFWLSVVPQLLLTLGSLFWGRILDRLGVSCCRLLIALLMTGYLICFWFGIILIRAEFIYVACVLQGLSSGGGRLTWALGSSYFAPKPEDVQLYNGIHFVLNGVRGLMMPWIGSILFVVVGGPVVVAAAVATSAASVPVVLQLMRFQKKVR